MNNKLRPCPFCGEDENIFIEYVELSCPQELGAYVYCGPCGAATNTCRNVEEAIKFWNTRPIEDALRPELANRDEIITKLKRAGEELYSSARRNYVPEGDADWKWRALIKEIEEK